MGGQLTDALRGETNENTQLLDTLTPGAGGRA